MAHDTKIAGFAGRWSKALAKHKLIPHALAAAFACALSACASPTAPAVIQVSAPTKAEESDFLGALALLNKQDRPLAGINLMEKLVEKGQLDSRTFAQFYAVTGDERGVYALINQGLKPNLEKPIDTTGYSPQPAMEAIINAARDRHVVMLNEDHTMQRQRAFAFEVATQLRKIGFTHFGAETFTPELAESMKDGSPKLRTGIYTLDPVFADLARHAAKIGYQLFDYEIRKSQKPVDSADQNTQRAMREQAQADNIRKILDTNPNAKMFIYVGGGHASKHPEPNGLEMMALRLKRMTGIDPLVIDQLIGTPRASPERDGAFYRGVANLGIQTASIVMTNASGQWLTRPGHDLAVFHPRVPDIAGRPGWLSMNGYRKPYPLTLAAMPMKTLVRAFVSAEPAGSIPMDQILVAPNQRGVTLMLPVGKYNIVRQSETGESTEVGSVVMPSRE